MKYLNFDVDLIVANEYGKDITILPFTLQVFIYNVRNSKLIQYLNLKKSSSLQIWPIGNTNLVGKGFAKR
jgi:hypothetical protein